MMAAVMHAAGAETLQAPRHPAASSTPPAVDPSRTLYRHPAFTPRAVPVPAHLVRGE